MRKKTTNFEYIEIVKDVHNDFYNYDKTIYVHPHSKIIIGCPIHGDFEQSANSHKRGLGCRKCGSEKAKLKRFKDFNLFEKQVADIFKSIYILDNFVYNGSHKSSEVICKIHGSFNSTPANLLSRKGCKKCKNLKTVYNQLDFENKANLVHEFEFDYSKSLYEKNQ